MTDDQRLRALDLRTEDVVLLRTVAGVALRIAGIVLGTLGVVRGVELSGLVAQGGFFTSLASGQVAVFFVGPVLLAGSGVVLVVFAGRITRRLIPHRLPTHRCPGCDYTITTLDAGRCTECGYLISPLRDAPRSASDRLLVARSIAATVVRLAGIAAIVYGVGRLVLVAAADLLLEARSRAEDYAIGREMLWIVITIVLGLLAFGLADRLARTALLGLRQDPRPKDD
ncbi:MAG: hypothetical protein RIB58_09135 [Phycisphaerales bacterium]